MEAALDHVLRVVLAEDHPIVRYGMRMAIESNQIARVVAEAGSPDELFSALEHNLCDIVVTDFSMPGGRSQDGLALIDRLMNIYPNISLVVVTALRNPALLNVLLRKGVKGLVGKTGDVVELHKALLTVMQGRSYLSPQLNTLLLDAGITGMSAGQRSVLTNREVEVLRLFAYEGLTAQQISARLNRSPKTISRHKRSALDKLGLQTNQELLDYCRRNELISC